MTFNFDLAPSVRIIAGVFFLGLFGWYFFRMTKGLGKLVFLVLVIVGGSVFYFFPLLNIVALLTLLLVILVQKSSTQKSNERYDGVTVKYEGGGIKRGLTPVEAAILLGRPVNLIFGIALLDMIKKDFIAIVSTSPTEIEVNPEYQSKEISLNINQRSVNRNKAASRHKKLIYPYEEPLFELLENSAGLHMNKLDFGIVVKFLVSNLAERIGGYDLEQTLDYYKKIVARAPLETRIDENLILEKKKIFNRNIGWILISDNYAEILFNEEYSFRPDWWIQFRKKNYLTDTFQDWIKMFFEELNQNVSSRDLEIKLGDQVDYLEATLLREIAKATYSG